MPDNDHRAEKPNNDFYIETYRPQFKPTGKNNKYTSQRTVLRVHRASKHFDRDILHPSLTSLWHVYGVHTQQEALAQLLESAAGIDVPNVRLIIGGPRSVPAVAHPTDVDADIERDEQHG